ncbi:endonuclease/exonuclease/phosphatase family protein [Bacillus sp. JCM 19041]|uniref:endonuclease/exonuclease/phosphatase family protein n=1 Tax=Bacillus sp. JCM 19041 TaxID=1460637 RepID=UPI0006CFB5D2
MKKPLRVLTLFSVFFVGTQITTSTSDAHTITTSEEENQLKVMSFNLRNGNANDPSPHSWTERRPTIQSFLESEDADIIGTQEVHHYQVTQLDDDLTNYDWIGLGREGGTSGEFMAIYYKSNRFTPLESGHYWLSDTPDVIGSTTWGNSIPRMVTWAKFQEVGTDEEFYFINTHFDHQSAEARQKSAELITSKTSDYDESLPMILTGDFNAPLVVNLMKP